MAEVAERTFPMQHGEAAIPWAWAEWFYRCYAALYGRSQSLERLAERGGSDRGEVFLCARDVADGLRISKVTDLPAGARPEFIDAEIAAAVEAVWQAQEDHHQQERRERDGG